MALHSIFQKFLAFLIKKKLETLRGLNYLKETLVSFGMNRLKETLIQIKTMVKVSSLYLLRYKRSSDNKHFVHKVQ